MKQPAKAAAAPATTTRDLARTTPKEHAITAIKLASKLATHANEALAPHGATLFARLGSSRMAVVELRSSERIEPAADEDKEQTVTVKVAHLEVAGAEQEDTLRQVLMALKLHRTSQGTLTEDGDLQLSASTLDRAAGEVNAIEAARLHAAIDLWTTYGRRVLSSSKTTASDLRREFDTVLRALQGVVGADAGRD